MKNKAVPMRKCVGCNTSKPKAELDRFVAKKEGETDFFFFDGNGRMDGRGIYVCKENEDCLKKASKRKRTEFRR